jgi:peptide/nickel transport system substrate-binding protein
MGAQRRLVLVGLLALGVLHGCTCGQRPLAEDAFVVLIDAAPGSLDPRFAISDYGAKISRLIFSSLVTVDTPEGLPELDLATAVENPSPTVYEVTLRRDATFHDGHPLTADDVVYTFGQLDAVGSPYAGAFRDVAMEALDDYRVRFVLPEPRAPFLIDLCMGIVPAHLLRERGTFGDRPLMGSGPFRFVGQRGEREIVVERNPDYYGGAPSLETISFRLVRDDNSRMLATLGGTAHLVQNAIPPLLLPVIERYSNLDLETAPSFKYTYIVFNLRHPILADRRVRQAICYAIDREAIIEQKFRGMARLATGLLAPNHWAYDGDVQTYPFDPERASALLDEAGYPTGAGGEPRFRLVFKVSSNKFRRSVAVLIAHQLSRVGIDVEVQSYEWGTFFGDVRSGNFEMATLQWPSVIEPNLYRHVFHSESIPTEANGGQGANRGAYVSPAMDRLIDAARRTVDVEERRRLYGEIQRLAAIDVPYASLWHEDNYVVMDRLVTGYRMVPNARFRYLTQTSLAP